MAVTDNLPNLLAPTGQTAFPGVQQYLRNPTIDIKQAYQTGGVPAAVGGAVRNYAELPFVASADLWNAASRATSAVRAPIVNFAKGFAGPTVATPKAVAPASVPIPAQPAPPVATPEKAAAPAAALPTVAAPAPTTPTAPNLGYGLGLQAGYADMQRQAVLESAAQAAATGNPDNASYRYSAALHALPALSGANNFAGLQTEQGNVSATLAQRQQEAELRAQTERDIAQSNIRHNVVMVPQGTMVNPMGAAFPPLQKAAVPASLGADGQYHAINLADMPQQNTQAASAGNYKEGDTATYDGKPVVFKNGQWTYQSGK